MRVNPYNKILRLAKQFAFNVQHPVRKTMWNYPKEKLAGSWRLDDLAERVQAADQLGHDVQLKVIDGALHVQYVKRYEVPFELRCIAARSSYEYQSTQSHTSMALP